MSTEKVTPRYLAMPKTVLLTSGGDEGGVGVGFRDKSE